MDLTGTFHTFSDTLAASVPSVLGALLILLVGWLIAKGIQKLVTNLLQKSSWDERLFKGVTKGGDTNIFVGKLFYYVLMVVVFLIVLEVLGVRSVLRPLENMVEQFTAFLPRLIAAGIIGFIGYMLASFVASLVGTGGKFLTNLIEKTGITHTEQVVKVVRTFVFIIIFIPILIQAINTLELRAIGDPFNQILNGFVDMIGNIILAAVILGAFIWGGKMLTDFLKGLFKDLGLDTLSEKIQIQQMIGQQNSFSKLIANILYFFIVFFGVITALELLQLDQLTLILDQILSVTGSIAFGAVILLIGNYIGILIYKAMMNSNKNRFVASVVRIAVLGLFIGISLRTMGIANEIVDLAFGLTLGALAVVVALAYGLGGREAAGQHFKEILQKFKDDDHGTNPPAV